MMTIDILPSSVPKLMPMGVNWTVFSIVLRRQLRPRGFGATLTAQPCIQCQQCPLWCKQNLMPSWNGIMMRRLQRPCSRTRSWLNPYSHPCEAPAERLLEPDCGWVHVKGCLCTGWPLSMLHGVTLPWEREYLRVPWQPAGETWGVIYLWSWYRSCRLPFNNNFLTSTPPLKLHVKSTCECKAVCILQDCRSWWAHCTHFRRVRAECCPLLMLGW